MHILLFSVSVEKMRKLSCVISIEGKKERVKIHIGMSSQSQNAAQDVNKKQEPANGLTLV